MKFAKYLRTIFFEEHLWWLLVGIKITVYSLPISPFYKANPLSRDTSSENITARNDLVITKVLLFGDKKLDFDTEDTLRMFAMEFHLSTERFSCLLIEYKLWYDSIIERYCVS